jgi:two-component system sensor histidine kinase TctE
VTPPVRRGLRSIRRALLLWLLLPLVVLVPLGAALMYRVSVAPALDSLDRALSGTAAALADLLEVRDGEVVLALSPQTARALRTDRFDTVHFAARDPRGRLLAGDADLAASQPVTASEGWQFFDTTLHGQAVRVAEFGVACGPGAGAGTGQGRCSVLVAESVGKRVQAQRAVLAGAGLTLLLLAGALVGLGVIAVRRGLRPLLRLSGDIEHRSLENLQPFDATGVPDEAAPIVAALNRLLHRLRVASLAQQSFLADAAHQLRTPLATLRTESELVLLEPHPPQLEPTLQRIHASAERAARLANQLLALAAADRVALNTAPLDLRQICTEAAEDWLRPSLLGGVDLGFDLVPAWVDGHAHLLRELLGNLLHNAIEYAGRGTSVTVRSRVADGHALLEVEDDGPGIPESERERVWERFQRGSGSTGSGSGLGLAIVRDIARRHGASTTLQPGADGYGLLVRVDFPLARPPDNAGRTAPAAPAPPTPPAAPTAIA